ncbi:hypothetical protein [Burkholderia cenocepacia]|uniref:hypothetical protein n=1 Tax=Burkholderia cenocepacia TaxID=95486 RepID=UPI001178AE30|nr:hypothetical protein [Burkholderia cenocepacia]
MKDWYTKNFKIYTQGRGDEVWTLCSEQPHLSFTELLTVFQHYGVAPLEGHDERNDYLIYNGDNFYYELAFSYLEKCWTLEGRWENSDQIRILGTPDYDYLKMLLLKLKIENETEDKATTNKRTKI